MSRHLEHRIRNVTAVLGPTNTGKTHLAIERMLGHQSGLIGLPLRLLAREVYDKIVARIGTEAVALITGEEKIKPEQPRYYVCTVEAMPREPDVDFLAIDEVQLAADPERGHIFTDRLLHARGREETLLLGAQTMRQAIADLIPGANFISRPRLSKLSYAGEKKITRLPRRTAVVAFSASEVYAIAELMRRQRGGAAVVLGALSPRTRNAQVALYQSGDVDFLVATDAIGMGLNLDVDHVAFAGARKFDGQTHRDLIPAELAQIAGRAGRHMNDGTFGVTGNVQALSSDLIERLETHAFDNVKSLQWRNRDLEFGTLDRLRESLRLIPVEQRLTRARMADDTLALETVSGDRELTELAASPEAVARLWDVCQVPDYRKISSQDHAELISTVYKFLMSPAGRIPVDWFAKQVAFADRTDGDIDTLATRISHIRTWTFVSNRRDWLDDPEHWQERTRAIEDSLSDALHECLTQRFIDRRTSALMRGLKQKDELVADIAQDGAVQVENHYVGRLQGFRFFPDTQAEGINGKAARTAAAQVLTKELAMRARRVASAKSDAFKLSRLGQILWRDEEIGHLEAGDDLLKPIVVVSADESMSTADKEKVQERLVAWLAEIISERLKPLVDIAAAKDLSGLARGMAFRLSEGLGVLRREAVAEEVRALDQPARSQLRNYGVRFGAFNIYFPALLKPGAVELAFRLWVLKCGAASGLDLAKPPDLPRPGLTSLVMDTRLPEAFYRIAGFIPADRGPSGSTCWSGLRTRSGHWWRGGPTPPAPHPPPKGATGDGGFRVTPDMMSILGCSSATWARCCRRWASASSVCRWRRHPRRGEWCRRRASRCNRRRRDVDTAPTPGTDINGAQPGEPAPAAAAEVTASEAEESAASVSETAAPPENPLRRCPPKRSGTKFGARAGRAAMTARRRHGDHGKQANNAEAKQAGRQRRIPPQRGKEVWRDRRQQRKQGPPGRREQRPQTLRPLGGAASEVRDRSPTRRSRP